MTFKIARLTGHVLITDKIASPMFARLWDIVAGRLEELITGVDSNSSDVAALNAGAAFRNQDNIFSGENTFQLSPNSDTAYFAGNKQVVGHRDEGWIAGTGTPDKAAFAAYAGQTLGAGYVQADMQALDDAAKAASQRLLAIEQALTAHGLIGP